MPRRSTSPGRGDYPMLNGLRHHLRSNLIAYLALFVALGGTGAYAANTIGSEDVIDNSLRTEDIQTATLLRQDHKPEELTGTYILDGSLSFFDLAPGTIVNSRLADNAVTSGKVASNTLTGDDVNEGTLDTRVKVRANQSNASQASGAADTEVNIPLTGNTWTQAGDEMNRGFFRATVSTPTCAGPVPPFGFATVRVKLDGEVLATTFAAGVGGGDQIVAADLGSFPGPGSADAHTLTATISDNCDDAQNFSVSDFKAEFVAIR